MSKNPTTSQEEEYFAKLEKLRKDELRAKLEAEEQKSRSEANKQTHWMKCPKCGESLEAIAYKGIEIDRCAGCKGIFLDDGELEIIASAPESGGFFRGFLKSLKGT